MAELRHQFEMQSVHCHEQTGEVSLSRQHSLYQIVQLFAPACRAVKADEVVGDLGEAVQRTVRVELLHEVLLLLSFEQMLQDAVILRSCASLDEVAVAWQILLTPVLPNIL